MSGEGKDPLASLARRQAWGCALPKDYIPVQGLVNRAEGEGRTSCSHPTRPDAIRCILDNPCRSDKSIIYDFY